MGKITSRRRSIHIGAVLLMAALAVHATDVSAGWLSRLSRHADDVAGGAARHAVTGIDGLAAHLKSLPVRSDATVIAAHGTRDGGWTFVNKAGERFTAATPDELKRAVAKLAPEVAGAEGKLALIVSEDSLFAARDRLKDLPRSRELSVLANGQTTRLIPRGPELFAEVRPGLMLAVGERAAFRDALWQLARPLKPQDVRVLSLEPGSGKQLASVPLREAQSKRLLPDVVDPVSVADSIGKLRGQTVLVVGRRERDALFIKSEKSAEAGLDLGAIYTAAAAADVNLVVLNATGARQPGAKTWLWRTVEVKGLDDALARTTYADFLAALGGAGRQQVVTATPTGALRTVLDVRPSRDGGGTGTASRVIEGLSEMVSEISGKVVTSGVEAVVTSRERQTELDQRLVPWLPSDVQFGYIGALIFGLFGLPVARGWWARIWPAEDRAEYGNAAGYHAARVVRGLLGLLIFVPAVEIASAPVQAFRKAVALVTAPLRWWRALRAQPS
jgi:hypothetical protein